MKIEKSNYKYIIGLFISFAISLYIRTLPKASVFLSNGFVRFSGNDPWYHLRNVQYIVSNYPHVLKWDYFTNYPYGTHQVFAQGYDFLIATICYIFSPGQYDQETINLICAYSPAVLGALCVIPVFIIAWKLTDNKNVGLLASFLIAIIPGQFLYRSMIGFNDHHVMEVFITTVTCMFFLLSLKTKDVRYYILSGISLMLYFVMWKGALLFALIIGVYVTIQILVDHMKGKYDNELCRLMSITFAIPLTTLVIFEIPGIYDTMSKLFLAIGILGLAVMFLMSKYLINKYPKHYYPIGLFVGSTIFILFSKYFIPSLYDTITRMATFLLPNGGSLTIGESSPFFQNFTLYSQFTYIGYFSIVGLLFIAYKSIKSKEYMFMFIWSLMILWAMAQQNRFSYYYAINACILASVISFELFNYIGLTKTNIRKISNKDAIPLFVVGVVLFSLIVPTWGVTEQYTKGTGGINGQWLESMQWMKYNTPYPGNDLNSEIATYSNESYGVMSWWDYGHWITVIANRMPNANPFQQGIGGRRAIEEENKIGASTFFTAQTEEEANKIMDELNSKYVVTDIEMATGKFYAMAAWTLDTDGYYINTWNNQIIPGDMYYNSIEAKLHLFDGSGLEHYKLVHESAVGSSSEIAYKQIYNAYYNGNVPEINTGYVKIFEYVEGVEIEGMGVPNSEIELYREIATNTGRTFIYSQRTLTDESGNFSVTVPYEGNYNIKVV